MIKSLHEIQAKRDFVELYKNDRTIFTQEYSDIFDESKDSDEAFLQIKDSLINIEKIKEELYSSLNM